MNDAVQAGKISFSKARRIAPAIKETGNAELWVQKAMELPQRELEREVAKVNPEVLIQENIRPVYADRSELRCGISPELEGKRERARELASRSLRRSATLEETIEYMADTTLFYKDPVQKAERVTQKKNPVPSESHGNCKVAPENETIPAAVKHAMNLRDRGECQEMTPDGKCLSRRNTNGHHIISVAYGGESTLDNLITLCRFHPDVRHDLTFRNFRKPTPPFE